MDVSGDGSPRSKRRQQGLNYKFQRMRERLREAVASGELAGKLPGERILAARYNVNAKTLSKALTDLAAEGLLERTIGRGTFVKGTRPADQPACVKWLIVCDADRVDSSFVRCVLDLCPDGVVLSDLNATRPSYVAKFDAVIDYCTQTPDAFLKDLVVRSVPVVSVNREPGVYSVNAVGVDRPLGASSLARDLILGGHRRLAVIQTLAGSTVARAAEQTAVRYAADAIVKSWPLDQVMQAIEGGATALICDTTMAGKQVKQTLEAAGVKVGQDISLAAIGCANETYPVSGYLSRSADVARAVLDVLNAGPTIRPMSIWIAPHWVDNATMRSLPRLVQEGAAA